MPEYFIPDEQVYDFVGDPRWECKCYIRSHALEETAYANSKTEAKKYAAYLCIINICGLENEYE